MRRLRLHNVGWFALLLWSVWGLYSCVSEVESEDMRPLEPQTVGMDLSFSAHPGFETNKTSRMTGEITQQEPGIGGAPAFRDIYQMKLFAYTVTDPNDQDPFVSRLLTPLTITDNGGSLFSNSLQGGNEKAGVVNDVSLFVGTNRCIGYAKANARNFGNLDPTVTQDQQFREGVTLSSWNSPKDGQQQGSFDFTASRFSDFYFGPKSIYPQYPGSELEKTTQAQLLLNWLNRIMEVELNGKKWGTLAAEDATPAILKTTYEELVKNASGAYENLRSLLESIYNRLGEVTVETDGQDFFNFAKDLRKRILTPVSETPDLGDLKFTTTPSDKSGEIVLNLDAPQGYQFPRSLGLPDGAIILLYDDVKQQFSLKNLDDVTTPEGEAPPEEFGFDGMPIQAYSYPAELLYRVNTPVKTSSQTNINLSGQSNWAAVVATYKGTSVGPDTKSAVLEQPFEYLVSCLETRAYTTADQLPDNSNTPIAVPAGGYPVTGILVGMQRFVGWDGKVTQKPGNAIRELQYLTYDRTMATDNAKVNTGSKATPLCYTLQLESASATIAELQDPDLGAAVGQQTRQMVVLELQNTGANFRGHQNMLITTGMRFYLVGELNLKTAYDKDQQGGPSVFTDAKKAYRIFEQGKRTQVTLKISTLAGAYNCIPDLRNPSLQIALQTDWNWQNGVIFDDNIDLQLP